MLQTSLVLYLLSFETRAKMNKNLTSFLFYSLIFLSLIFISIKGNVIKRSIARDLFIIQLILKWYYKEGLKKFLKIWLRAKSNKTKPKCSQQSKLITDLAIPMLRSSCADPRLSLPRPFKIIQKWYFWVTNNTHLAFIQMKSRKNSPETLRSNYVNIEQLGSAVGGRR